MNPTKQNVFRLPHIVNPKVYVAIIIPIVFVLSIVQMIASNRLATEGEDIRSMEDRKIALSRENQELKNKIAKESSLAALEEKVKTLEMKKVDRIDVVEKPEVAVLP